MRMRKTAEALAWLLTVLTIKIWVPALAQQSACRNGTRIRLLADGVKYGCSALAQSYGLQTQELLVANAGQLNCDNLTAGQILCIPPNPRTDPSRCSKTYRIVSGDTCEQVAQTNG